MNLYEFWDWDKEKQKKVLHQIVDKLVETEDQDIIAVILDNAPISHLNEIEVNYD